NGTHVQSLWHSLLKNDGQMKMNGLGLIDQTFLYFKVALQIMPANPDDCHVGSQHGANSSSWMRFFDILHV
ncbi:hypothetical protein, partial [Solemya velum gill symbiont]|uniref:hypothetical protein n=1 Tax=Solemya velum gill symbiont TaxID=2340 RepID=UPI001C4E0E91